MNTRNSRSIWILPALIVLASLIAVPVFAQPSSVYDLSWNTPDGGTYPLPGRFWNGVSVMQTRGAEAVSASPLTIEMVRPIMAAPRTQPA